MQILEKILEEIDNRVYFYDNADEPMMYVEAVKDIIRKYMENDGWIPVLNCGQAIQWDENLEVMEK